MTTVEKFFDAFVRSGANVRNQSIDSSEWTFPKFMIDQGVWAAGRPATIVGYLNDDVDCGAHPGQYKYTIRFDGTGEEWTPWPYCESQLTARD